MTKTSLLKKIMAMACAGVLAIGALTAIGCSGTSSSSSSSASSSAASSSASSSSLKTTSDTTGLHHAVIEIEGYGPIEIELDADAAPVTVENFMDLAKEGFYDNLTFHRIMEGFMMQGGDPNGDGTGGSETNIVGEFLNNGYDNDLTNVRGAIAMARSQMLDSASSQFFIVQEDSPWLDGQYAVFGHVTSGMDIVDAICAASEPIDDNGTILPENQPVITKVTIID